MTKIRCPECNRQSIYTRKDGSTRCSRCGYDGPVQTVMTEPEVKHPSPDTRWFVDYHCDGCGQMGTARFNGNDMVVRADGVVEPIPTIFCCICRSNNNLYYDDIESIEIDAEGDGMTDQEPGSGGDGAMSIPGLSALFG